MKLKIDELQKRMITSVFKEPNHFVSSDPPCRVLQKFMQSKSITLERIFGKLGIIFSDFLKAIDRDHPHTNSVLNGLFKDEEFLQDVLELLPLTELAIQNKLTRVLPTIVDKFLRHQRQHLEKAIKLRLIKDEQIREMSRRKKRMQIISLKSTYKKGVSPIWESLGEDLGDFCRFSNPYRKEIEEAQKKADRFSNLGCPGFAGEIIKSLEHLQTDADQYCGFNRITMTNAALMLARNSQYRLERDAIVAPVALFPDYNFMMPMQEDKAFDYEPKAYPYHQLEHIAPGSVKIVIERLEKFPDLKNKPVFDNFIVLVPSMFFPNQSTHEGFKMENLDGEIVTFFDRMEATKTLDIFLILKEQLTPILLGEKDGKCYFICYWK